MSDAAASSAAASGDVQTATGEVSVFIYVLADD